MNKKYLIFLGLGFELLGFMLCGLFLGSILDELYVSNGVFSVGLVMFFLLVWFIHFFVMLKKLEGDKK